MQARLGVQTSPAMHRNPENPPGSLASSKLKPWRQQVRCYAARRRRVPYTPGPPDDASGPTLPASVANPPVQQLLVVEAFAGSYSVAHYLMQQLHQQGSAGYQVSAYAAVEMERKFHSQAPTAADLGLARSRFDNIRGSVSSFSVQARLLRFIRKQLQSSRAGVDAVVFLGGPPCTAYSQASKRPAQTKLAQQQAAYCTALLDYQEQCRQASGTQSSARAAAAEVAQQVDQAITASAAEAARHARRLVQSDSLVNSFLSLFKAAQAECEALGRPCYLLRENPYSQPARALWNRPFMQRHLMSLPSAPAAQQLQQHFVPDKQAWLRPVFQHWCTYGAGYSQKPTIIFTNLPDGVIEDRYCKQHCQRPDKSTTRHAVSISTTRGAHARAKWPVEFVGTALHACVQAASATAAAGQLPSSAHQSHAAAASD